MAQHGKSQLHTEVHQAMERREVHVGHNQKGVCMGTPFQTKVGARGHYSHPQVFANPAAGLQLGPLGGYPRRGLPRPLF